MRYDMIDEVWSAICRNKRRSILTAFGVFWGAFMLVTLLGTAQGIRGGMLHQLEQIPRNMTVCRTSRTTEPYDGFRKGRLWYMNSDDIPALEAKIPEIKLSSPIVDLDGILDVSEGTRTGRYLVKGVDGNYTDCFPVRIVAGRYINEMDVRECRKVVVLGQKIVNDIFYGKSPVGRYVDIGGTNYLVIGISVPGSKVMNYFSSDEDEYVAMPYTLVQKIYNRGRDIDMLALVGDDRVPAKSLEGRIGNIIKSRHGIAPEDKIALQFTNSDRYFKRYNLLKSSFALLIWIVGIGTLLSGIVGVSNIIMITVKERTREIGIRCVVGAKPSDIVSEIMVESLLFSVVPGLVGLVAGVALISVIGDAGTLSFGNMTLEIRDAFLDFWTAVGLLAILVVTGLLAGIIPAKKALKILPVDSLKIENT